MHYFNCAHERVNIQLGVCALDCEILQCCTFVHGQPWQKLHFYRFFAWYSGIHDGYVKICKIKDTQSKRVDATTILLFIRQQRQQINGEYPIDFVSCFFFCCFAYFIFSFLRKKKKSKIYVKVTNRNRRRRKTIM